MSESFPVESVIERSVNSSVNSLVGNNDTNLKTIVKMSLMSDMNKLNPSDIETIIQKIHENNEVEKYYIEKEYELTYDLCGNIIPVGNLGSPSTPP